MEMNSAVTVAFNNVSHELSDVLRISDIRMHRAVEDVIRNELLMRPIDSIPIESFRLLAKLALDLVLSRVRAHYCAVMTSLCDGTRQHLLTTGLFGQPDSGNCVARFETIAEAMKEGSHALNRPANSYVVVVHNDYLARFAG